MPPYSFGRWGAQSPAWLTLTLISSRSSILQRRARSRSSSGSSPARIPQRRSSWGRISALTRAAVRRRMSLTAGSRPGMGATLIATGLLTFGVGVVPHLRPRALPANRPKVPTVAEYVANGRYCARHATRTVHVRSGHTRPAPPQRGSRARRPQLLRRPLLRAPLGGADAAGPRPGPLPAFAPGRPRGHGGRHLRPRWRPHPGGDARVAKD